MVRSWPAVLVTGSSSQTRLRPVRETQPGHMIADQLNAGAVRITSGVRDVARLRAASRDPATGGRSGRATASYGAGPPIRSSSRPRARGRDAAGLLGIRSPGMVTIARSAASSIRSRRSISSPRYGTSDASSAVLRGRIRGEEGGQAAQERGASAHRRPRGHLGDTQAPKREEAPVRAGRRGGICGVVQAGPAQAV